MKLSCIVCAAKVDNWDEVYPENSNNVHPLGGTVFRTYGHYGSSVFDPMDASYLDIVICDSCLKNRLDCTYAGVNEDYQTELDVRRAETAELVNKLVLKEMD